MRLFAIEAVMFLVLGAAVATVRLPQAPERRATPVPTEAGEARAAAGARCSRDRAMVRLCVLGFVLFFACYGQFESGLSAYAVEVTRISPATLGIALAANTAVIVLAQFVVLQAGRAAAAQPGDRAGRADLDGGVDRGRGCPGWCTAAQAVATALLISTYALFGIGEAMLSPTVAPLVADLAPASAGRASTTRRSRWSSSWRWRSVRRWAG